MNATFQERFEALRKGRDTLLCVGLDPDPSKIPAEYMSEGEAGILAFLKDVSGATAPLAAAFKPNLAFFEALGPGGWDLLAELLAYIRSIDPKVLLIADAKRGDIGNTAAAYARAFFEALDFDAITLSPYMGRDTIEPFLAYRDRAAIILCLTSNPGAEDFEMTGDPPLYLRVAREVAGLHERHGNVWMVVGATRAADQVNAVREAAPGVPWLVPGVGAQGGSMSDVIEVTGGDVLINASRSILYAGKTREAVAESSRRAAMELVEEMRRVRR